MKHILYIIILTLPCFAFGNFEKKPILDSKTAQQFLTKKLLNEDFSSPVKFVHKGMLGMGIRNFRLEYQANVQFSRIVEIGVGLGLHTNSVKFFSSSDEHKVLVTSLPTYGSITIYPYHDDNRAFYIKGNYGFLNNVNSKKNKNEKGLNHKMLQVGVGYKYLLPSSDRYVFFELSKYTSTAKGTYSDLENYDSVTDYNLTFHAFIFTIGVNINRY